MIPIDLLTQIHRQKNDVLHQFDSGIYERVKNTILNRDNYTCQCCGFSFEKYQGLASLNDNVRDLDNLITVCIFCQQCFQLENVEEACSGVLIWLPEFTQKELNRLTRILFIGAHARKDGYLKFEFFIQELLERKKLCVSTLGVTKPLEFIELLKNKTSDKVILEDAKAIRLFPTYKVIRKKGTLEYNQFPGILASWKMDDALEKEDLSTLKKLDKLFYNEEKFEHFIEKNTLAEDTSSLESPDEPTLAQLACKLLKDAAGFFKTLANQNTEIEAEMKENASVFEKMAELLLQSPLGAINDKTYAELAGRLLTDAADFFDTLAEQNEPIREQMSQNADIFRQIATLVEENPLGNLSGNDSNTTKVTPPSHKAVRILEVAGTLLIYAADLFAELTTKGIGEEQEMKDYAKGYRILAEQLQEAPLKKIADKTRIEVTIHLMKDFIQFLEYLGFENSSIQNQIKENLWVFKHIINLLENDPFGYI